MKPTNQMAHFRNGGNSVLGLQVMQDDTGAEFVHYGGEWTHLSEVPLPRLHTSDIETVPVKTKRTPVFQVTPVVPPDVEAFKRPKKQTVL